MDFKIAIDTSNMEKQLHAELTAKMKNVFKNRTESFFGVRRGNIVNGVRQYSKGDGIKEIDEKIENKFLDPKFQESLEQYFDHNWEEIFKECMTRAHQHKANGIAFNKVHKLP